MARATDLLDDLHGLFDDATVRDLLVTASGEVYLGTDGGRRPSAVSLQPAAVIALAELLGTRASAATAGSPAFTTHLGNSLWTVLRPPLSTSLALLARRCPRRRPMLGEFVDHDLMSPDIARRLVETVREGRNLLVSAPDQHCAVTVLDALLTLGSPGQLALYIGDARCVDTNGTATTVLDRHALEELRAGATEPVFEMLRQARWVFIERLAAPRDLHWWFGGDAYARGRIGAICATSTEAALRQLEELHRELHGHRGHAIDGLVDAVLFVEHLRPGRGQTFVLEQLSAPSAGASQSGATPRVARSSSRPTSTTAVAAAVAAEPVAVEARPREELEPRPQRLREDAQRMREDAQRMREELAAAPADDTPSAAVHRRGSRSSPRLQRPRSDELAASANDLEHARTGSMPRVEKPDTAPAPQRPDSGAPEPAVAASTSLDDFGDFGDLFADEASGVAAAAAPADESELSGPRLFGPGELDDVLGPDLLGEDDEGRASSRDDAGNQSSGGFARHTHRSGTRANSASRYNADTTRHDAEQIRASRYKPEPASSAPSRPRPGSSNDTLRSVRRPTPSPLPAFNASAASPAQPAAPGSDRWSVPGTPQIPDPNGGARPLVGRGAPTRQRVHRPQSADVSLSSADIEFIDEHGNPAPPRQTFDGSAFMQEGTLDDDVVGDFASEPTRRAEWPKDGG